MEEGFYASFIHTKVYPKPVKEPGISSVFPLNEFQLPSA